VEAIAIIFESNAIYFDAIAIIFDFRQFAVDKHSHSHLVLNTRVNYYKIRVYYLQVSIDTRVYRRIVGEIDGTADFRSLWRLRKSTFAALSQANSPKQVHVQPAEKVYNLEHQFQKRRCAMFPLVEFPELVRHYAPYFKKVFSAEAFIEFERYVSGLTLRFTQGFRE